MNNQMMLTPKDVLYLTDLLDQSEALNKRIAQESTLLQTKEVKNCFAQVNEEIVRIYDQMLTILETEAKK